MADNQDPQTDHFKQAEEAFNRLELDQKAKLLVQETVAIAIEAVDALVDMVSEEGKKMFDGAKAAAGESNDASEKEPQAE